MKAKNVLNLVTFDNSETTSKLNTFRLKEEYLAPPKRTLEAFHKKGDFPPGSRHHPASRILHLVSKK